MAQIIFIGGSRLLRGGLKTILEEAGDIVIAEYPSIDKIPRGRRTDGRSIYLLKHSPGDRSIRDQIPELKKTDPGCGIAVLVERLAPSDLVDVFAAGGDGLLLEEIGAQALHQSLKLIEMGEKIFPSQLAPLLCESRLSESAAVVPQRYGTLTAREVEIVRRLTAGFSNKEIAIELNLAVATVKVHVKSLLKKLGLSNRTQAAIWAMEAGLVDRPRVTTVMDDADDGADDEERSEECTNRREVPDKVVRFAALP